ncbi:hypothetical protein, partial [Reichenbachiella sp. MALMAid0571]|uniref:hypothetical protein n=1 Tax=Reichenbachiella sp. MALMAid0571 TaxID=3143939 RepID=UPI0032DFFBD2
MRLTFCPVFCCKSTILVQYYKHIIDFVDIAYFNDLDLIPNIEGNFNKIGVLLKPDNLNDRLIELGVCRTFNNQESKKFNFQNLKLDFDRPFFEYGFGFGFFSCFCAKPD